MNKDEQIQLFYSFIEKNYKDLIKKYRQMCFLNHIDFNEDTFQDTIIKVVDIINKKGLKGKTEKEIENYFFNSFKFNTYQHHLQESKKRIDDNINPFDLDIEDVQYSEDNVQFADMAAHYILSKIREHFDNVTSSIWRIRYMVKINGEELNYKKIKALTGVADTRRRIVEVNKWIRDNISMDDIKQAIKENKIFL